MPKYLVVWKMEIEADSERAAARRALEIHRDPESIATVFHVFDGKQKTVVDLSESLFECFYRCPRCDETWYDVWECACDDRCPTCGTSCSPEATKEI